MRRRLFVALVALALVTTSVSALRAAEPAPATDISGKWSGPVTVQQNGQTHDDTLTFEFKQTGTDLTGSGAPSNQGPAPLKGKVDGAKVTFDVTTDGPVLHFALTLENGHLKGAVTAEQNGNKVTGTVDLQKAK